MNEQKDSASEGVSEAAPEADKCGACDDWQHTQHPLYKMCNNCWLVMPWREDGRVFHHKPYPYVCSAENEMLVADARVHQPPEQNLEDKNSVSGASDHSTSRIPRDITLTVAEIRAALVAELQRINQYVLWQDQSWCRNENERQMVEDNEAQDREKFADAVLARIGITQLTKTALRGHNPELSQDGPTSLTEFSSESASTLVTVDEAALLPCPFCGSQAAIYWQGDEGDFSLYCVAECEARPEIEGTANSLHDEAWAIMAWNRRATELSVHQPDVQAADREWWKAVRHLIHSRLGAMTNAGLSNEMYQRLWDDIKENLDIAAEPRGLDWLQGKCSLQEYQDASLAASPVQPEVSKEQDNAKS